MWSCRMFIYMMKNEYIEKAKRLSEQEKNIAKNKWQCMCPHCSDPAINSHLLQRHGLLSHIVENGHLYGKRPKMNLVI